MANVVYADPFGSYIKGQQEGQAQAINLGAAQRQFRDSDLNAEFMKWYMPYRQREAQAETAQKELATNIQHGQYLAALTASGDVHAQAALAAHLKQVTGMDIDFSQQTPQQTAWIANMMLRNVSPAFTNPYVTGADHVGRYVPGPPSFLEQQQGESVQDWADRLDKLPPTIKQLYGFPTAPTMGGPTHSPILGANQNWLGGGQPPIDLKPGGTTDVFGPVPTTPATSTTTPAPVTAASSSVQTFALPAPGAATVTPLPPPKVPGATPETNIPGNNYGGGHGAFETPGETGTFASMSPMSPLSAQPATLNGAAYTPYKLPNAPVNAPTDQLSPWHDERNQQMERMRGPVKQMGGV